MLVNTITIINAITCTKWKKKTHTHTHTHQKHKQYSQQQNQYKMRDKVNPTAMKLTNLLLSIQLSQFTTDDHSQESLK